MHKKIKLLALAALAAGAFTTIPASPAHATSCSSASAEGIVRAKVQSLHWNRYHDSIPYGNVVKNGCYEPTFNVGAAGWIKPKLPDGSPNRWCWIPEHTAVFSVRATGALIWSQWQVYVAGGDTTGTIYEPICGPDTETYLAADGWN